MALGVGPAQPAGGDGSFSEFGPYFFAFAAALLAWRVLQWVRAKPQAGVGGDGPEQGDAVVSAEGGQVAASDGRVEVLVAWWGGFVMGPVPALVLWFVSARGASVRASARAAALYWLAALALWSMVIVLFITEVIVDSMWLLAGAGLVVVVSVLACTVATARRGGAGSN